MYPLIQQIFSIPTMYRMRLKCSLPFMKFALHWGWGHKRHTDKQLFANARSPSKETKRTTRGEPPLDWVVKEVSWKLMFKLSLINSMLWEETGEVHSLYRVVFQGNKRCLGVNGT